MPSPERTEPELSLVIPTRNERASIEPLLGELRATLAGLSWEALFVDDSSDGTDGVIAGCAATDPRVRLYHRAEPRGGLAGAVMEGFSRVQGVWVCVLDADLQHPPSMIPALLAETGRPLTDVVIASRYIRGGSSSGLDGPSRQFLSWALRWLARLAFPTRLMTIADPLAGYFLVRRSLLSGVALRPTGYKILLEILVRCRWREAREVAYHFQPRRYGVSKSNLGQGLRFLHHLGVLAWDCSPLCRTLRVAVHGRYGKRTG